MVLFCYIHEFHDIHGKGCPIIKTSTDVFSLNLSVFSLQYFDPFGIYFLFFYCIFFHYHLTPLISSSPRTNTILLSMSIIPFSFLLHPSTPSPPRPAPPHPQLSACSLIYESVSILHPSSVCSYRNDNRDPLWFYQMTGQFLQPRFSSFPYLFEMASLLHTKIYLYFHHILFFILFF